MRLAALVFVLIGLAALAALVPSAQATSPSVSMKQPWQGEVLSGWVGVKVDVVDSVTVQKVSYFIDGRSIGSSTAAPYFSDPWDSVVVADGQHTVNAVAYDAAGTSFASPTVTFTVQNGQPAPPVTTTTTTPTTTTPTTTTPTTTTPTTTTPTSAAPCSVPYSASSPWNTPIASNPTVEPGSATDIAGVAGPLTSDPTQYTYPVYDADGSSPVYSVKLSGRYSNVTSNTSIQLLSAPTVSVPIPASAQAAAGSDAQLIILEPSTGDEWGFWQLYKNSSGQWQATNGYHYNTNWSGVPPKGFGSRGAGVPYLAGLVRPCEIAQGHIDHALAFAYSNTAPSYVWPATKSDGASTSANALPEGARLQLDPSLTTAQLQAMGITGPELVVAKTLQKYGMYLIDSSGRSKVMFEYSGTANWGTTITAKTVSGIPIADFRWVAAG